MDSFAFTVEYEEISNVLVSDVEVLNHVEVLNYEKGGWRKNNVVVSMQRGEIGCGSFRGKAIWDTGATGTVITERVVKQCGLEPVGIIGVRTVGKKK